MQMNMEEEVASLFMALGELEKHIFGKLS